LFSTIFPTKAMIYCIPSAAVEKIKTKEKTFQPTLVGPKKH
jgi:hypothetical protein